MHQLVKRSLLFLIFVAVCSFNGFSQEAKIDTLKEIEELKGLKSLVEERADLMKKDILEIQILIDSIKGKADTLRAAINQANAGGSKMKDSLISEMKEALRTYDELIKKHRGTETESKRHLREVNDLLKELELRISQLSRKST